MLDRFERSGEIGREIEEAGYWEDWAVDSGVRNWGS